MKPTFAVDQFFYVLIKLTCTQGAEESYLTVMLAKFIAQIDLVLNSKQ